jgi:hypothetical protein
MSILYFRMDDANKGGLHQIDVRDAQQWNDDGWGIFWTVNEFNGDMKIENFKKLRYWYVDVDLEDISQKPAILFRLENAILKPSMIVETRRGYHAYWRIKDGTTEDYKVIQKALSAEFGGDNLSNLNRVLRVPGMKHWKDKKNPFLVELKFLSSEKYTFEEMLSWLTDTIPEEKKKSKLIVKTKGDSTFDKMGALNCKDALEKLSGTTAVKKENYSFRDNFDGTYQIMVDGKTTGAWIDSEGYIGSYDGGGPTIIQWLRWFGNDWKKIAEIGENLLL